MRRVFIALFAFVIALMTLGVTPPPAFAQGDPPPTTNDCDTWFLAPVGCLLDPLLKAAKGALNKQAGDIATATFSIAQFIVAGMGICDSSCNNPLCPKSISFQNSALTGISKATLAMYQHPPAETAIYLADLGRTLGFRQQVQAQGIGFSGLSPLLDLWKAFRNIAYALLAVIMIVVGFMVMFRRKIDPKTVVTVQNAIPRIVIALLLVTFSYAIVGVMIDLMYLAIILTVSVISGASPALGKVVSLFTTGGTCVVGELGSIKWSTGNASSTEVASVLLSGGPGQLLKFFMGSGFQVWDDLATVITSTIGLKGRTIMFIGGIIGGFTGGKKGAIYGLLGAPALFTLIILIVLIFGFIRLFFMLLDAYINIIISLLIAPFQLMMEAVPGTNAFAGWFKNLLSKIIAFPLTAVLLMIAAMLTSQDYSQKIWAPPLLSSGEAPLGMAGLTGLGMLMVIPGVVGAFQKGIKAEPVIQGGVGTILEPIGSAAGQLLSLIYYGSSIWSMIRHKPETRTPFQVAREGTEKGVGSMMGGGGR